MRIDMTQGSPVKGMLKFSAPMLAASLLMQLTELLDSLIVSRAAGLDAFAAIAAAAPVAFLSMGLLMGLSNGFILPIALSVGAGDRDAADRYAWTALFLTAGLSVIVSIPATLMAERMLSLSGTPDGLLAEARNYLCALLPGTPFTMVFVVLSGILRAEGDTRTPLKYQALAMGLHVALDVLLIALLRVGVIGAALSGVLAHAVSCVFMARRVFRARPGILRTAVCGVRPEIAKQLLGLGLPIALANLITSLGATAFQFAVNRLGSSAIVAVAASERLLSLIVMPAMVLGGAAEVFSGQNYGANRPDRIRGGIRRLSLMAISALTPAALLFALFSDFFIPLMIGKSTPEVLALAGRYMIFGALFVPFDLTSVYLKNMLQGVGMPERAVVSSVYDLLIRVSVALFGAARFGFWAVALANPIAWALSAVCLFTASRAALAAPRTAKASSPQEPGPKSADLHGNPERASGVSVSFSQNVAE